MKQMKKILLLILIICMMFSSLVIVFADDNIQYFEDPLADQATPPDGVAYTGFTNYNISADNAGYPETDPHGFRVLGGTGYAEYDISNASSMEVLYYVNKDWGGEQWVAVDPTALTNTAYVAWGIPKGETAVPKYISKTTGLLYARLDGSWWVYTDYDQNGTAVYTWYKTGETAFAIPDEADLYPYGVGFSYTTDGENWQWAEATVELDTEIIGNFRRETWKVEQLPPMAQKVRVYLNDRTVYVSANTATGEPLSQTASGSVGWYISIANVKIDYLKNIAANQAPVARDTSIVCLQGRTVDFTLEATDADGDPVSILFDKTGLKGDIVKVSGTTYRYVAPSDTFGEYSFTYRAYDKYAYSDVATVKVTVTEHNGKYTAEDLKMTYPTVNKITLNSIFSDGAVLQQHQENKIWGVTLPENEVTVTLKDKNGQVVDTKMTTANSEGYYSVVIGPRDGSFDVYSIEASDRTGTVTANDVLFGEVWLSAGQSNMELQAQYCVDIRDTIRDADNRYLRFFLIPTTPRGSVAADFSYTPVYDSEGRWGYGNVAKDIEVMSGVSYAFALKLFDELKVPVAIINTSIGSTSIEAWISRKGIEDDAALSAELKARGAYVDTTTWNTKDNWNFNQMTAMFNHKIAPIAGYGIKGILWYQGCNNVGGYEAAQNYKHNLKALVQDWSYWFGCEEELPLCFSQLAPAEYNYAPPECLAWFNEALTSLYLENSDNMAYTAVYDIDKVYQSDLFAYDAPIHPLTKKPVGERMAAAALWKFYGLAAYTDSTPPTVQSWEVVGSKIVITYNNVGQGLKIKDGDCELVGFTICGADNKYIAAKAKIIGKDQVEVYSPYIAAPTGVSYAFSGMNMESNLVNSQNFPAAVFRSDKGKVTNYYPKDWTAADSIQAWLEPASGNVTSGYYDVWVSAPVTGTEAVTLQENQTEKLQGNASISATYGEGGGAFGVQAVTKTDGTYVSFDPIFGNIELYKNISIYVYNPDGRDKSFGTVIETAAGETYTLCLADTTATRATVGADGGWTEMIFSLEHMVDKNGNAVNAASVLSAIRALAFCVEDSEAGSIFVDDVSFLYDVSSANQAPDEQNPDEQAPDEDEQEEAPSVSPVEEHGCKSALSISGWMSMLITGIGAIFGIRKKEKVR